MWQSRKFRALVLDFVFSASAYAVTNFAAPELRVHALWFITAVQPIVVAYVLGVAMEDSAALNAGVHVRQVGPFDDEQRVG